MLALYHKVWLISVPTGCFPRKPLRLYFRVSCVKRSRQISS